MLLKYIYFCLFSVVVFSGNGQAKSQATTMTNNAVTQQPQTTLLAAPVDYYFAKNKAVSHAQNEQWQQSLKILTTLTDQYKNDGVTWYLLGLSYFNLGQYQLAIPAFKEALALGSHLKNIPTGASTPNDLMVKIAEAYGSLHDSKNAMLWLEKSLTARWDDKPKLAGRSLFAQGTNPHFKNIENSTEFKKLAGNYLAEDTSRDQGWRLDLTYLVNEIKRLHVNPFHQTTELKFQKEVAEIANKIPELSDQQIVFEFMQLMASLGNGHNFIIPAWGKHGNFNQLPFQFYQFTDGLYIVKASPQYAKYIGHKVHSFSKTLASDALNAVAKVNGRDNNMQQLWLGPYYLSLPSVLAGLGIIENEDIVTLTLVNQANEEVTITPEIAAMNFAGFPKLPANPQNEVPLYLEKNNDSYWSTLLTDEKLLYVQFNDVRNKSTQSLKDFNQALVQQIQQSDVKHFVLDLRHNSGGDGSITPPMVATAVFFQAYKPDGKLFILMGRNTFSAGHDVLMKISRLTDVIFVGEPSGTRPNAIGEAGWFNLPYSQQTGIISSQFHQEGSAEDHRIWVAPDVPVSLSSAQYFAGEDPALAALLAIIAAK